MEILNYVVEETSIPFTKVGDLLYLFISKGYTVDWEEGTKDIVRLNIGNKNSFNSTLLFKRDYDNKSLILPKGKMRINNQSFMDVFEAFALLFNIDCKVYKKVNDKDVLIKSIKNGKILDNPNTDLFLNEEALKILIDYKLLELNNMIEIDNKVGIEKIENELLLLAKNIEMYS